MSNPGKKEQPGYYESSKNWYNNQYESWMPWVEDKVLGWMGTNKASYATKGAFPPWIVKTLKKNPRVLPHN